MNDFVFNYNKICNFHVYTNLRWYNLSNDYYVRDARNPRHLVSSFYHHYCPSYGRKTSFFAALWLKFLLKTGPSRELFNVQKRYTTFSVPPRVATDLPRCGEGGVRARAFFFLSLFDPSRSVVSPRPCRRVVRPVSVLVRARSYGIRLSPSRENVCGETRGKYFNRPYASLHPNRSSPTAGFSSVRAFRVRRNGHYYSREYPFRLIAVMLLLYDDVYCTCRKSLFPSTCRVNMSPTRQSPFSGLADNIKNKWPGLSFYGFWYISYFICGCIRVFVWVFSGQSCLRWDWLEDRSWNRPETLLPKQIMWYL